MSSMKTYPNHKSYKITKDGQVYSLHRNKFLKQTIRIKGYKTVAFDQKIKQVGRLVAETYIPNPYNFPCVNYKDKNPSNNNVDNLEWCTYSENNHHRDNKLMPQERFNEYISICINVDTALNALC
jgi:hypothetical protein